MKAVVFTEFGSSDVRRPEEIVRPEPKQDEILVRVRASSVNFGDIIARTFRHAPRLQYAVPLVAKTDIGWRMPRMSQEGPPPFFIFGRIPREGFSAFRARASAGDGSASPPGRGRRGSTP